MVRIWVLLSIFLFSISTGSYGMAYVGMVGREGKGMAREWMDVELFFFRILFVCVDRLGSGLLKGVRMMIRTSTTD